MRANASASGRRRTRESGQALVEFALILPLFLVIVVGIIQFGIGLNYWLDLQRISNQGARWGAVNLWPADPDGGGPKPGMSGSCLTDPTAECSQTLQAYLASEPISGSNRPCVVITFPNGPSNTTKEVGDPVKVELAIPFTFLPILNLGTIKLTAVTTMRLEQKPTHYDGAPSLGGTTC